MKVTKASLHEPTLHYAAKTGRREIVLITAGQGRGLSGVADLALPHGATVSARSGAGLLRFPSGSPV